MNIEEVHAYCLSFPNVTDEFPFDEVTLVFKVNGKMFLALSLEESDERFVLVKCAPEQAIELRERYAAVQPGYYMNKKHWNSLYLERDMSDTEIRRWIRHSYRKVVEGLPKREREQLLEMVKE